MCTIWRHINVSYLSGVTMFSNCMTLHISYPKDITLTGWRHNAYYLNDVNNDFTCKLSKGHHINWKAPQCLLPEWRYIYVSYLSGVTMFSMTLFISYSKDIHICFLITSTILLPELRRTVWMNLLYFYTWTSLQWLYVLYVLYVFMIVCHTFFYVKYLNNVTLCLQWK